MVDDYLQEDCVIKDKDDHLRVDTGVLSRILNYMMAIGHYFLYDLRIDHFAFKEVFKNSIWFRKYTYKILKVVISKYYYQEII